MSAIIRKVHMVPFYPPRISLSKIWLWLLVLGLLGGILCPPIVSADDVWESIDLGTVEISGTSSYDVPTDTFTLEGAGTGFVGTSDSGHFLYTTGQGSCEVIARVVSVDNTSPYATAGLMLRSGTGANSAMAYISVSPMAGIRFTARTGSGSPALVTLGPVTSAPVWLRIRKAGNWISGYTSQDGLSWSLAGEATFVLEDATGRTLAGLAVSSHQSNTLAEAQFEKVSPMMHMPVPGPKLRLWLRPDAGVVLSGSNKVSRWEDQSNWGNHAVQTGSSNRPEWVDNVLNRRPVVRFTSGSNTFLNAGNMLSLTGTQSSLFAVVRRSSGTNNVIIAEKY
jgi:hypothetical protein